MVHYEVFQFISVRLYFIQQAYRLVEALIEWYFLSLFYFFLEHKKFESKCKVRTKYFNRLEFFQLCCNF